MCRENFGLLLYIRQRNSFYQELMLWDYRGSLL